MAFQYIEGDFPAGTVAQCKEGNWMLVLPRTGLFKAPPLVMLRGQVRSVEVVKMTPGGDKTSTAPGEGDWMAQIRRTVRGLGIGGAVGGVIGDAIGGEASKWGTERTKSAPLSEALWNSLGGVMGSALGKKELPVLCVLEDGKFFLANVSRKDYEWLENQVLMRTAARRFRSIDFAEAALALCALMSALHGWVDGAKKARVSLLIASDETLKTFPAPELETKFAAYCRALLSNAETGRRSALDAVGKLEGKTDQARTAVQLAVSLSGEDAVLDAMEQKLVREVCALLEIYPGEFGLFYSG